MALRPTILQPTLLWNDCVYRITVSLNPATHIWSFFLSSTLPSITHTSLYHQKIPQTFVTFIRCYCHGEFINLYGDLPGRTFHEFVSKRCIKIYATHILLENIFAPFLQKKKMRMHYKYRCISEIVKVVTIFFKYCSFCIKQDKEIVIISYYRKLYDYPYQHTMLRALHSFKIGLK